MKWQSYTGVSSDDRDTVPTGTFSNGNETGQGHFISGAQSTQGLGAQQRASRPPPSESRSQSTLGSGAENTMEGAPSVNGHVSKLFCWKSLDALRANLWFMISLL